MLGLRVAAHAKGKNGQFNGVIIKVNTRQPFTYADPCVEYGPTLAYNEEAATEARKAVKDFVTTTLKP